MTRLSQYNLARNIEPAQEALLLIEEQFPQIHTNLIRLAASGSHVTNPYHNLKHELQHVYWSNACLINSGERGDLSWIHLLILASLFHDHNHSGGKHNDNENIARAIRFVELHVPRLYEFNNAGTVNTWNADAVVKLIRPTLFSKETGFPIEPTTLAEKCMRDADLMSIYTGEGRSLLLGLFDETGTPLHHMTTTEFARAITRNEDFLRGAEMFTDYGKMMKEDHLEDALKAFRTRAERYIKWSRGGPFEE